MTGYYRLFGFALADIFHLLSRKFGSRSFLKNAMIAAFILAAVLRDASIMDRLGGGTEVEYRCRRKDKKGGI